LSEYRVALEVYDGPLDLLLFLIRREEVDIYDIPIARITEQYIQYVEVLKQLDPETSSEFLVLAATLMEIKSRMLLPKPPPDETEEEMVDPRLELVRQLLEYKKYKDAAHSLEEAADEQALKHARRPVLPPKDPEELELDNLEIWDLFDAFNRILEQIGRKQEVHEVTVDDTPMALHAEDMVDSLERAGGMQEFEDVFTGRTRAEMIGLFLALLELIRRRCIRVSQDRAFGPIRIHLLDAAALQQVDENNNDTDTEEITGERVAMEPQQADADTGSVELPGMEQRVVETPPDAPADGSEGPPPDVTNDTSIEETIETEPSHEAK
jgi:segregation and condensation protein A